MKRSFIALISCLAIITPSISSAAIYQTPSDLLKAMEFDGRARDFSMEVHLGSDTENMYASAWLNGSAEGVTPQAVKARINTTLDLNVDGLWMRSRFELAIHNMTVYMRLQNTEGDSGLVETTDLMNKLIGKWVRIPIDPSELQALSTQNTSSVDTMLQEMSIGDLPSTAAELENTMREAVDNMFTMRREKFPTGYAYFLDLKPDFLHQLARIGARFMGEDPMTIMHDPEIMNMQTMMNDALDAEIKVDTNLDGSMQFGRMALHWHQDGMHFSLMGSAKHRLVPVYLEVPTETMSTDELARMLESAMPAMSLWTNSGWEEDQYESWDEMTEDDWSEWEEMLLEEEWDEDMDWEEEEWNEDDMYEWDPYTDVEEMDMDNEMMDMEMDESSSDQDMMNSDQKWDDGYYGPPRRAIKTQSQIVNRRSRPGLEWNTVITDPNCTATPGTIEYLQQTRKGICPLVRDVRPGRGSRR